MKSVRTMRAKAPGSYRAAGRISPQRTELRGASRMVGGNQGVLHARGLHGEGKRIDPSMQSDAERYFSADLGSVRVHDDAHAHVAAAAVAADAFSEGTDVAFAAGRYAPHTSDGRHLLMHELAHVVQRITGASPGNEVSGPHDPSERDATQVATAFTAGRPRPSITRHAVARIARQENDPSRPARVDPVRVVLDPERPWLFTVEGTPAPTAIAIELYGVDVSVLMTKQKAVPFVMPQDEYELIPELLVPFYRDLFHSAMRRVLEIEVDAVEDMLLETWPIHIGELMAYVTWWARRKDLRTETGQSYFDAFLARLKRDRWYTDYLVYKSASTSYLDTLYTKVGSRLGELVTLVAQNSVEFGAYRPIWLALDIHGAPKAPGSVEVAIDRDLIKRSANIILAGLKGVTWESDSRVIRDILIGLPPPERAAVLREIMSRYDETEFGIFGKYGEAWEGGMLYWLFEDLADDDRGRVAAALRDSGVLPPQAVDALVAGRGWGGRWLPFTTYKAQEAAQYWADVAVEREGGVGGYGAAFMGGLASLWLPETAGITVATLATAGAAAPGTGAFAVFGQAFPRIGTGLAVAGTGVTSFNVTIAVQEVVLKEDVWTRRPLSDEEQLSRGLMAFSGTLFLGASFLGAAQAPAQPGSAPPSGGTGFGPPRLVYSGPGRPTPALSTQPAAAGGGERVVLIARGNTVTRVVISEPAPVQAPAAAPHLRSVPLTATAPAATTASASLSPAPGAAVAAATAGAVATSIVPREDPIRQRPPIVLYLPAAKGGDLERYSRWIGQLQHRPGRPRDTNQDYRWRTLMRGRIPTAVWQLAATLGIDDHYVLTPYWSRTNRYASAMQVDHVIEMQVTPFGREGQFDNMANYRLMDASNNASVGSQLEHNIRQMRESLAGYTRDQGWMYRDITFERVAMVGLVIAGLWTEEELIAGEHLDAFVRLHRPVPP